MASIKLGYIPLTDSLPLFVARECGFFEEQGLSVELSAEASWANIRDKLVVGHLQAAQMLAPMPLASTLGLGGLRKPMLTAFSLGLNGNAITVSDALFAALQAVRGGEEDSALGRARVLAQLVRERASRSLPPLVFASVYPYSCHYYQLRYWMRAGGIDPDRDVQLVVLPPTQMVDNMRLGHIDGFCVGEPWNSVALQRGIGRCLVSGYEIWQNAPEKVLGVTADWQQAEPEQHAGLIRALWAAARWCESHIPEAIALLGQPSTLGLPREWVAPALEGCLPCGLDQQPCPAGAFHAWHRYQANFPWRSYGDWLLSHMRACHRFEWPADPQELVDGVFRTDIYRAVLGPLAAVPERDRKVSGEHTGPWLFGNHTPVELGPDALMDGQCW